MQVELTGLNFNFIAALFLQNFLAKFSRLCKKVPNVPWIYSRICAKAFNIKAASFCNTLIVIQIPDSFLIRTVSLKWFILNCIFQINMVSHRKVDFKNLPGWGPSPTWVSPIDKLLKQPLNIDEPSFHSKILFWSGAGGFDHSIGYWVNVTDIWTDSSNRWKIIIT